VIILFFGKLLSRKITFGKKLFLPKDFLIFLSLLVGFLIYGLVSQVDFVLSVSLWLAFVGALVVFVVGVWIFKAISVYSVWKLMYTRFLLACLAVCTLVLLPQSYLNISKSVLTSSQS